MIRLMILAPIFTAVGVAMSMARCETFPFK
jgi:hypothetical protein